MWPSMFLEGLVHCPAPLEPNGGEQEIWHIEQILHLYGVYLSVIIFQPELECSNSLDGDAQSYSIDLAVSVNDLEVAVILVCAI